LTEKLDSKRPGFSGQDLWRVAAEVPASLVPSSPVESLGIPQPRSDDLSEICESHHWPQPT